MARTIAVLIAMLNLTAFAKPPKKRAPARRIEICGPIIKQREAVVFLYKRKPPVLPESLITTPKRFTHDTW